MPSYKISLEIDRKMRSSLEVMDGPEGHLVVIHGKYTRSCKVSDPERKCYAIIHIAYRSSGKLLKITPIKNMIAEAVKHELFQEDFTEYLADLVNEVISPQGVAIILTVNHFHDDIATSIATRGCFTEPGSLNTIFQVLNLPTPERKA
ncbi:MAG: GTP cyclohydrolase I [Candidatus Ranarchaeia archaeon]